ncbi:MAG TPA: hypothetical protein VF585_06935 [Chthoniobacterales bacterium]|jgi:hypothetical protein
MFETYLVMITPNSHLIYGIVAISKREEQEQAKTTRRKVRAVIGQKYEEQPSEEESIERDNRRIHLSHPGRGTSSFHLVYSDGTLAEKAAQEECEHEQKEFKEGQMKLVKDADATGI